MKKLKLRPYMNSEENKEFTLRDAIAYQAYASKNDRELELLKEAINNLQEMFALVAAKVVEDHPEILYELLPSFVVKEE